MSREELERVVDRMLQREARGDTYKVDASSLRDDEYELLLDDLDRLEATYISSPERQLVVQAPAIMSQGHEILTLFRNFKLVVDGI